MTRTFHPRIIPAKIISGCSNCPWVDDETKCSHPKGVDKYVDVFHPGFPDGCPLEETP
jgi:hypothetical protein